MTDIKERTSTDARISTVRINEMGLAFMSSKVLMAGMDLDLFSKISQSPATIAEIARSIGIAEDATEKLVATCASLGLLLKQGDRYCNAADVEKYLVRGKPSYFGDYLLHMAKTSWDRWTNLEKVLRTGTPSDSAEQYRRLINDPKAARELTEAGYTGSIGAGHLLAKTFDFSRYSLLLDLGGGSGAYSIAAALRHPNLNAIVMDLPTVCVVTEEIVAKSDLTGRIRTHVGDFLNDDYPPGADVILNCGNLHAYGPDDAQRLMHKCYKALPPGGAMIWLDYMMNDERTGPAVSAMVSLSQLFAAGNGRVHSGAEMSEYMRNAGFTNIRVSEFIAGSMGRVTAEKPS